MRILPGNLNYFSRILFCPTTVYDEVRSSTQQLSILTSGMVKQTLNDSEMFLTRESESPRGTLSLVNYCFSSYTKNSGIFMLTKVVLGNDETEC